MKYIHGNKIRVLFIDDRKSEFEMLKRVFSKDKLIELVNSEPCYDIGSEEFVSREKQKKRITDLIENEKYNVVLFDLSLRDGKEEDYTAGMAEKFLSVQIYKEEKEWLIKNNIKFVFVTSHEQWASENEFREIGNVVEGAYFMRKVTDEGGEFCNCPWYDKDGNSKCGEEFANCNIVDCFNKRLRRIVNGR